jgi:tetratricopeptide (TPR) repeat protein
MIADFGLAKRVSADDRVTQSGTAVGTPSYMAPEQAAPSRKGSGLTMAADVYSLGAILYELLTGRPPFRGTTALETLRDVLEREPPRPRALNAAVDRDLETVCLKCLDKDPARRYASAAALAEDLERFLHGEPVQARPVSRVERLRRWCRRNRALALATSLAAVGLVAVTTVAVLLWVREAAHAARLQEAAQELKQALGEVKLKHALAESRRETAEAHEKEAHRQRRLEEESFRQAHKAVNDFCVRVSKELRTKPGMQPLRKQLLEAARGYYQRFLEQRAQDPRLKRELAEAQFSIGLIASEIGPKAASADAYRAALKIYQEQLQVTPGDVNLQARFADTVYNLAIALEALGQPKESLATYLKAQDLYERLLRGHPGHPSLRAGLADIHSGLGSLHRRAGRFSEAVAAHRKTTAIYEQLAAEGPPSKRRQDDLALAYNNRGVVEVAAGLTVEALSSFEKAREIRERRHKEEPRNPGLMMALAASYRDLGLIHRDRGESDDALRFLNQARDLRARAVEDDPKVIAYQADLACSHMDIGQISASRARGTAGPERLKLLKDALDCYQKALPILEQLVRADPTTPNFQSDLAKVHFQVGTLSMGNNQPDQAERAFATARRMQVKLVQGYPDVLEYRNALGGTLNNLARVLMNQRRAEEARPLLLEGIEQQRVAVERAPRIGGYRTTLNSLYRTSRPWR